MSERTAPVWKKFEKEVQWAGIFGSSSPQSSSEKESRLIYAKVDLASACGRKIDLIIVWPGPTWAWGSLRVEAMLTARTVYGDPQDIVYYRLDALEYVNSGLERFRLIDKSVSKIKAIIAEVKTSEAFTYPSQQHSREAFLTELGVILHQLDLPVGHPTACTVIPDVTMTAGKLRRLINEDKPDVKVETAPFWEDLWVGKIHASF
ncbi:hypothetical protein H0H92_003236 [Tricholoma furcatifolium]|nr:hypothetical protein H0H92_003236 [Tricholoma furcatifolium]